MKDIIAENRFVLTRELFMEGAMAVWRARSRKSTWCILVLTALAGLGLFVYTVWRGESLAAAAVELPVLVLAVLWCCVYLPRRRAGRAWRTLEEQGRADCERVAKVCEDTVEIEAGGTVTGFALDRIAQVLFTRRLMILISDDNSVVMLDRNGFSGGTERDILSLLKTDI